MWEGDYYFLEKLDQEEPFQMHLYYDKDKLDSCFGKRNPY